MPRLRLALIPPLIAALAALALSAPARSDEPPASSPAARAVLAGEDRAQGSDIPALSEPLAFGDLAGKPIVSIYVAAQGGRWLTASPITSVELGEPLSAEAARRAIRELLASGSFARASVEAFAVEGGAGLRLAVLPRRLIAGVQITGATLDRQDTLDAAGVSENGELTGPILDEIAERVRAFYVAHGYTLARAAADAADTDDRTRVVLSIHVVPGAPRTITQRVFVVDPIASKELGPLKQRYRLGVGARVDEPGFTEADREMADVLHQSGFHRAEVAHRVLHDGPTSTLYVYLTPGPRIVPTFDGNRSFDDDALSAALQLTGSTETKANELVDRLRTFYVKRGFLDVEVSAVERGGASDPVHYLAFTIRENAQVRVTKRVFPCLTGDLSADDLGKEIETFLDEDLPGSETFSAPDPLAVIGIFGPTQGAGGRGRPVELIPAMTYTQETYDRALKHIRDLYYSRGYLNAVVGPVSVVRATCSHRSPAGVCVPERTTEKLAAQCRTDVRNLPLPEPQVPEALACRPDPARHIECAPEVTLRIPIHLGPQSVLYDLAFEGNKGFCAQSGLNDRDKTFCAPSAGPAPFSERWLSALAELEVGQPLSNLELDAARLRLQDAYRNLGYAFAEVRTVIEPSPDRTRARARFVISERERVTVSGFVIKGAIRTDESLILRRVLLRKDAPFRQEQARLSEERIATLGAFASVSISLEDPEVPQKNKRVVISVVEQLPQYLDPRIGFSTGEGIRFAFEYGHRNIGGYAVSLTLRVQLSYLFEFLISDAAAQNSYDSLSVGDRLERRNTLSINIPEFGLGPLVNLSVDGIDVRDNQRDFGLTKQALIPAITYRPRRTLTTQLATSIELNDVGIFNGSGADPTILLKVPLGRSLALAQRVNASWDVRDNPFNATKGILLAGGVEHVNTFPLEGTEVPESDSDDTPTDDSDNPGELTKNVPTHFLRFTGRIAGYIPFTKKGGTVLALSLSGGYNYSFDPEAPTYPDRRFFLGGVDSLRGFLADAVVPQDIADDLLEGEKNGTLQSVVVRGGNVSLNPRAELRIPLTDLLQTGIFLDTGNVWADSARFNPLVLRYAIGAGLRVVTPIGPLALDYGINVYRRPGEPRGALHFSVGLF